MTKVEIYIAKSMRRSGHAGRAKDLKFVVEQPARNAIFSIGGTLPTPKVR